MNRIVKVLLCSALLLNGTISHAMDHDAASSAQSTNVNEYLICKTTLQGDTITNESIFTCAPEHKFICCDSCMAGWIQTKGQNATCPYCRAPLREHFVEIPPLTQAVLEEVQAAQEVAHIPAPAPVNIPVDEPDNDQATIALLIAVTRGQLSAVQILLRQPGIDVNTHDANGNTPLINAAYADYLAIMQALLAHPNININARDNEGKTALMWAAEWSSLATVQTLLAHHAHGQPDADVNAHDNSDSSTLSYAANDEIRQLLIAHGAHE